MNRLLGRFWEHFWQTWSDLVALLRIIHFRTGCCSNDVVATDCHHHKTNGEHHYHQTARCAYAAGMTAPSSLRPSNKLFAFSYSYQFAASFSRFPFLSFSSAQQFWPKPTFTFVKFWKIFHPTPSIFCFKYISSFLSKLGQNIWENEKNEKAS